MTRVRFHFAYTLRYIKYTLLLALIPLVTLLLRGEYANYISTLIQEAILLVAMGGFAFVKWWVADCRWDDTGLEVRTGFLYSNRRRYPVDKISVVEIDRPLYCRLLGAAEVTVYFSAGFSPRKKKLTLSAKNARRLADGLLPDTAPTDARYTAQGVEQLVFLLLSSNVVSTALILFFTYRQILDFAGARAALFTEWVYTNILSLEQLFEVLLPAGAALVTAILTLVALVTLTRSLLHTFRYTIRRAGGLLVERCGLLRSTERRIRLSAVGFCDVRTTPLSRLLRRRPVYIAAGGYKGTDVPVILCKRSDDAIIQTLLPGYSGPKHETLSNRRNKSLGVYLWMPGSLFALSLLLFLTASQVLPGILPLLAIPMFLSLGCMLAQVEGYFREGAAARPGGGIWASHTRFFTRHDSTILGKATSMKLSQSPMAVLVGRATLRISTPSRIKVRVRGIGHLTALEMRFTR